MSSTVINEKLLKQEERAVFALRSLYGKYGYLPYKMSKFEEYELYIRNKDFLVSDRIITFNDTNGKLLALKPDVTLSIIRNGEDVTGVKQKVCYNENVYRVSESSGRYKEILQTGLECIGDIDLYDIAEVISLAAKSLAMISDSFVLEISDLGILSSVLSRICSDPLFTEKAIRFISEKNRHDLRRLCSEYAISEEDTDAVCLFVSGYGERNKVIEVLRKVCREEDLSDLITLSDLLSRSPYSDKILLDFSLVNNMNYYNGFVFKGFLDGLSTGVLAGGQYDRMMEKMGRRSGAIGFAVYLDLLEQMTEETVGYDVNVLLLYDESNSAAEITDKVEELVSAGLTVSAQKSIPSSLRYRELVDLRKESRKC